MKQIIEKQSEQKCFTPGNKKEIMGIVAERILAKTDVCDNIAKLMVKKQNINDGADILLFSLYLFCSCNWSNSASVSSRYSPLSNDPGNRKPPIRSRFR